MVQCKRGEQIKVLVILPAFLCLLLWNMTGSRSAREVAMWHAGYLIPWKNALGWMTCEFSTLLLLLHWALDTASPEDKESPPTALFWRKLHISILHFLYKTFPHSIGDVQFQTLVLIKKVCKEVIYVLTILTLTNLCHWLLPSLLLCIILAL